MDNLVSRLDALEKDSGGYRDLATVQKAVISEYRSNPIVQEAMSGYPDAFIEYVSDLYMRKWTTFRPWISHTRSKRYNRDVDLGKVIFNDMNGFRTEGVAANDNPIEPAVTYGGFVWSVYYMAEFLFEKCGKDISSLARYATAASIIAGVVGFIKGSGKAIEKYKQRKSVFAQARKLGETFQKLYGREVPLYTVLKRIERNREPGEARDEAMRRAIKRRQGNIVFEENDPKCIEEFVNDLWKEKWEFHSTHPRIIGTLFPNKRDLKYNEMLKEARKIFPYIYEGFVTLGVTAVDNSISGAFKYSAAIACVGKTVKYLLPSIGAHVDKDTMEIFDIFVESLGGIAYVIGTYKGIRVGRAKYRLRKETSRQAEWLSKTMARLFPVDKETAE